ncbi:MFS transporter [Streptomyces sp. AJS327]|uniref:peptide MFS transporter n=1 Tax=Streptomyces sp. AJS327 TaxID=2545265 RepID=UPI0015DEE891|nr:oligopeptide:H+ symporter [Streptomyces sp. AJS327]MBA0049452.1 MFS transporter [Streptomyces sp. AJS327]
MASSPTQDAVGTPGGKTFFGHPRGLATLFMTEMWERFSFYGMRALLVVYLISGGPDAAEDAQLGGLAMTAVTATAIYSVYNAMVYLLTMPGGWLGDRVWGPRGTVAVSGVIIVCGHLSLTVPGEPMFFVGLALIATGSGLMKANISTMVGHLYDGPDDPRRDGGFTIFYMGINTGSLLATLLIGYVGQQVNWHLGFGLAALGMALGVVQFLVGSRHLSARSSEVPLPLSDPERRGVLRKTLVAVAVTAAFYSVVVATGHFTLNWAMVPLTILGLAVPALVIARIKRDRDLTDEEQRKMTGFTWFFVVAAVFWMIYDQGASTVQTFGETRGANSLFGLDFPSSWYQSLNPAMILLLAPVFAAIWLALNRRGREPSTTGKFSVALVVAGLSFFVFALPMTLTAGGDKASPLWLVLIFLLHTVAELCLSPVGLSVTTKLAPAKYGSQLMAVFFLAVTAGNCVTGLLSIAGVDLRGVGVILAEATLAVIAGVAMYANRAKVKALMGSVR